MSRLTRTLAALSLLPSLLGGCATIPEDFKQPGVSVQSITPRIARGLAPEFDILLRVTNPNRKALSIKGLAYTIDLAGHQVVDGVASDLPRIPAYGEAEVTLNARADLFRALGLLSDWLQAPGTELDYEFNADIDLGTFYPMLRVTRSGVLSLE